MLAVLTAVVAVLVPLTAVNLIMLFAVIRRLREAESRQAPPNVALPAAGTRIGADAAPLLADKKFAACVLVGCEPCAQQIEALRTDTRFAPEDIVFFVFGGDDPATTADLAASVSGLGTVVQTAVGGAIAASLGGITSFPTLLRTDGEQILAAERSWSALATAGAVSAH
ncbi:hypothetical protein Caci_5830 [Catenulispora acidiphila DSM 44928]|uniref:Thioredoxin domain-containing protein n=1 Tax=Catenulispora acidiphila (strain DSM 44928 / JCM 14897 / NBRC 102108 / NRRL B-24433 / ID139908) TaxID=479433 RepID=C7QDR4_CATAD|nr:hypothetical protein [Catenulispora acidiphila]ACU74688.1 hypothetical protein Caci_5830 [Catenulispora acidiphila DSM 44928]